MKKSRFYLVIFIVLIILFLIVMIFPQDNLNQTNSETSPRFEIDQSLLKILVKSDEIATVNMRIMNVDDNVIGIAVQPSFSMEDIVTTSDAVFDIKPGQTKIVKLAISGKSTDTEYSPGVYAGKILVKSDTVIKEVPIIIEIESKYVLFDTNIYANTENRQVLQGTDSVTEIKLFNLMGQETTSVNMEYYIKDMDDNTIITESESAVVTTQTTFTKMLKIPSNLKSGMYVFAVNSKYGSSVGTSSYLFYVYSPSYVAPDFITMCIDSNVCLMGSFVLAALLIMVGAFAYIVAHIRPDYTMRIREVRKTGFFESLLKRYDKWEKNREHLKELQIKERIKKEREQEKKKGFFEVLLRRHALHKKREERLERLEKKKEAKVAKKSLIDILSKQYAFWKNKRKHMRELAKRRLENEQMEKQRKKIAEEKERERLKAVKQKQQEKIKIKIPKIKHPKIKLPKFNISEKIKKIKAKMKRDSAERRKQELAEKRKAERIKEINAQERKKKQLSMQRKLRKYKKEITFGIPHSLGLVKTKAEKVAEANRRRAIAREKQRMAAQKKAEEQQRISDKQKQEQQRRLAVLQSKRKFKEQIKLVKNNTFSILNKIGLVMTPAQRRAAVKKKALEKKQQAEKERERILEKQKAEEIKKKQELERIVARRTEAIKEKQKQVQKEAETKKQKEQEKMQVVLKKKQEEDRIRKEEIQQELHKQREKKQKELQRKKIEYQRKIVSKKAEEKLKKQIRLVRGNIFKAMNQLGIIKTPAQKREEVRQRALENKKREEEMQKEAIERMRIAYKKAWANPELRKQQSEAIKQYFSNP
ncbi:MAG: hypothetical protein KJ773_09980, partial [Candidatus Thermoplasmatota archaeon]|nr:hypothetical protein [Candidatus Thermoplasmatota archaeon]